MIRSINLEFDPTALNYIPESLAREECVLPLGLDGEALRIAFGRREVRQYDDLRRKLRFVTARRLFWCIADRLGLEHVIDEVYTYRATEVTNCPPDSRYECPRRWLALQPGERSEIRFCKSCNRKVYLCVDKVEAIEHAGLARRIAIYNVPDGPDSVDCISHWDE